MNAKIAIAFGVLTLSLAACAKSTPTASSTASAAQRTATTVAVRKASVGGASESVLTTASGQTLYYKGTDTATKITCTGACAANWPPLLLSSGTPTGPSSLSGTLSTLTDSLGRQVLYNGHPLYRFISDTKRGDVTGDGVAGFHVATADLAIRSVATTSPGSGY